MIAFNDGTVNRLYKQLEVMSTENFNGTPAFEAGEVTDVSVKFNHRALH